MTADQMMGKTCNIVGASFGSTTLSAYSKSHSCWYEQISVPIFSHEDAITFTIISNKEKRAGKGSNSNGYYFPW